LTRISDELERDVVHLIVEKRLFSIGKETCDLIGNKMREKYGCYFEQCLDHPEYLLNTLSEAYGSSAKSIVDEILDDLKRLSITPKIESFQTRLASFCQ
jgi:hypothetical protein